LNVKGTGGHWVEQLRVSMQGFFGIPKADFFGVLERYFELLKESKVKGYLFQQQNYVPKE
jgi:hypothetical protein